MFTIHARNVQQALPKALQMLSLHGVRKNSRNGPVHKFPAPVATTYERPAERVIFHPSRDANPFFHLYESLWMLAGRNDLAPLTAYLPGFANYSDDGVTLHGAYGYRWRAHFDVDQLYIIANQLKANPDDRRNVLSMWDARADLGRQGKDLPCNLQAVFMVENDMDGTQRLDMMVTNRSNDILLGAYGANAVHFSYLHEFMARAIGVRQGLYTQVSANFHAYENEMLTKVHDAMVPPPGDARTLSDIASDDPYAMGHVEPFPLMTVDAAGWLEECSMFLDCPEAIGFTDPFFRHVAIPMHRAYMTYKETEGVAKFDATRVILQRVRATDWQRAAIEWVERRRANFLKKAEASNVG